MTADPDSIDGRYAVRKAVAQLLPDDTLPAFALTDLFAAWLDRYAEIIVGPGGAPVGFMTHGEGPEFTDRVRLALERLELPAEAVAHHAALAAWMEHKRGFFKAEWHRTARGLEPLAAIYFRRRPQVGAVLDHLDLEAAPRDRVRDFASALDKDTIHFVSAAFRPDRPVHHKLYCSQWVTAASRADVAARIERVFELHGTHPEARAVWRAQHDRCCGADDTTVFVSTSVTRGEASTSFKIDYPDLSPDAIAAWLPEAGRRTVVEDARRTMALAGTKRVTFTGVRFSPDQPYPSLKYYGDVPGSQ
ncbi:MAG: hypothetical protein KF773_08855 [Deltaproteobacteria bacterium]|nr:hypothetical protein [Deltaproteobacteria bacterium]MCW5806770.1 hypothetical protein [Deltaproteobacteria bacterium]